MITLSVADVDGVLTIRAQRGKGVIKAVESVGITPDLLLSFGGHNHTADAQDLIRAVVSELNGALVALQGGDRG